MTKCYCAEIEPGRTADALANLERQKFKIVHPTILVRDGRHAPYPKPAFPGYLFLWLDLTLDRWRAVNGTRGIRGLIRGASEFPSPLPSRVADEIERRSAAGPWVDVPAAMAGIVQAGMPLRVTEGPMMGHAGPCVWAKGDRLRVLFAFFGVAREVEIRRDQVEIAAA